MIKKMSKYIFALFLCFAMIVQTMPISAAQSVNAKIRIKVSILRWIDGQLWNGETEIEDGLQILQTLNIEIINAMNNAVVKEENIPFKDGHAEVTGSVEIESCACSSRYKANFDYAISHDLGSGKIKINGRDYRADFNAQAFKFYPEAFFNKGPIAVYGGRDYGYHTSFDHVLNDVGIENYVGLTEIKVNTVPDDNGNVYQVSTPLKLTDYFWERRPDGTWNTESEKTAKRLVYLWKEIADDVTMQEATGSPNQLFRVFGGEKYPSVHERIETVNEISKVIEHSSKSCAKRDESGKCIDWDISHWTEYKYRDHDHHYAYMVIDQLTEGKDGMTYMEAYTYPYYPYGVYWSIYKRAGGNSNKEEYEDGERSMEWPATDCVDATGTRLMDDEWSIVYETGRTDEMAIRSFEEEMRRKDIWSGYVYSSEYYNTVDKNKYVYDGTNNYEFTINFRCVSHNCWLEKDSDGYLTCSNYDPTSDECPHSNESADVHLVDYSYVEALYKSKKVSRKEFINILKDEKNYGAQKVYEFIKYMYSENPGACDPHVKKCKEGGKGYTLDETFKLVESVFGIKL